MKIERRKGKKRGGKGSYSASNSSLLKNKRTLHRKEKGEGGEDRGKTKGDGKKNSPSSLRKKETLLLLSTKGGSVLPGHKKKENHAGRKRRGDFFCLDRGKNSPQHKKVVTQKEARELLAKFYIATRRGKRAEEKRKLQPQKRKSSSFGERNLPKEGGKIRKKQSPRERLPFT